MIDNLSRIGNVEILSEVAAGGEKPAGQTLSETFEKLFAEAERNLKESDQSVLMANSGGPVDLHEVMIAMEKADISLRFIMQVRNKAIDAYQEIMRMQV